MREFGTLQVNAPAREAFELFTPSGERRWAPGWDPRFPVPPADETAPGTVFTTLHSGHETIWVVTACERGAFISYARVTPKERAGTIEVRCVDLGDNTTRVEVTADLTALDGTALDPYAKYLQTWERLIAAAI